ncbi:MAG: hypothetical protein V4689_22150 [Verrucomicrobiota bacterium]
MTATHPPYKPQRALGIVPTSIAIALILSPAFIKLGIDQRKRAAIENQFESRRSLIFSRIDSAVARQDLETLTRINDRYAGSVSDGTFRSAIREAMAKVTAREAELELAISRHLDLIRDQEQSPLRPDPLKPQIPSGKQVEEQPLSKLPR